MLRMPEICRFYGIVIRMFYRDHRLPHFHVEYGDREAVVESTSSESRRAGCPQEPSAW